MPRVKILTPNVTDNLTHTGSTSQSQRPTLSLVRGPGIGFPTLTIPNPPLVTIPRPPVFKPPVQIMRVRGAARRWINTFRLKWSRPILPEHAADRAKQIMESPFPANSAAKYRKTNIVPVRMPPHTND